MFFCRFNGFLKLYWIIIKFLWKLYEMYIQSREEIMFFCRFNRFLKFYWIIANLTEPISNNFHENGLPLSRLLCSWSISICGWFKSIWYTSIIIMSWSRSMSMFFYKLVKINMLVQSWLISRLAFFCLDAHNQIFVKKSTK